MPMIEVTIFDAAGNVVEHRVEEAETATQEEIDEAVALIKGGMTARDAMMLAKQHIPK